MGKSNIIVGKVVSDGGDVNISLGGVPDYIKVINIDAAVTEIAVLEWFHGMGDDAEVQYDKFVAGTDAGDFFLKKASGGLIAAWEAEGVVGNRKSCTFDDTGGTAEDLITCSGHGYSDGDKVMFIASGGLPTHVSALSQYYVIDATATTFRISATKGGTAVNFGSDGTPPNYVFSITDLDLGASSGVGITVDAAFTDDGDTLYYIAIMADEYNTLTL